LRESRKCVLAVIVILGIFTLGAIGYWIFSADMPDGLERTMENAGVGEQEPVYKAPLDYGGDYPMYILMGAVGFFAVLISALGIAKLMAKKNETQPDR
jgi:cobalt/nickel transport protein